MAKLIREPDEMQKRLTEISKHRGVAFGRVHELYDHQKVYGMAVTKYGGYLALSDAFKSFFLETVETFNRDIRPQIKAPQSEFFAIFLPRLVNAWQSLCGSECLALRGYALQAYSLHRNIFDALQILSAALQRVVDFYAAEGVVSGQPLHVEKSRRLRMDTEYEANRAMSGSKSGLSQKTIDELARWNKLFDYEVHGGRLSLARTQGFMKGTTPLPVFPAFVEGDFAMFMNRYCEIAWMAHRLVPLIQPPGCPFNTEWKEKWRLIDESFGLVVSSLTKETGKPIGEAVAEYVETKFPFNQDSAFPL